jgi:hypothetical protein
LLALADPAYSAYGVGVTGWRGARVLKVFAALVLTAIASQLLVPVNTPGPKSTSVVNKPFVTATALFVTGPATAVPVVLVV